MRRLVLAFAGRTYHIVGNLMWRLIYSNDTSQERLSKAWHRQFSSVIQVHDKLHENLIISACSFYRNNYSSWEFVEKKFMVKNSSIETTYVVGKLWNCPYETIPLCTKNICYWKWGKLFWSLHLPCSMYVVFASFKHLKVPICTKIPVTNTTNGCKPVILNHDKI